MNKYKEHILVTIVIFIAFLGSIYSIWNVIKPNNTIYSKEALIQPDANYGKYPWFLRSVDTQVVSKHWENVSVDSIKSQIALIKETGANYVAVATPYDRPEDLKMWVEEIHNAGMNVWFRSHWNEWEGDWGVPATLDPKGYLNLTKNFIINNPDLFKEGDSFTMCVEAENVGVGIGKKFLNWGEFKTFLLDEIVIANDAFDEIGLKGKVHTNWLSLNAWTVENIIDKELAQNIGLIAVDHYFGQSTTIGDVDDSSEIVDRTIKDLEGYHNKFDVPILLGEWGYQIHQNVSDVRQANVINQMLMKLRTLDFLIGVNYWAHMGNTASIFSDEKGEYIKPRLGAEVLRYYFNPLSFVE